jgi:hypothetical protein
VGTENRQELFNIVNNVPHIRPGIRIGLATVVVSEYLNRNEIVINLDNTVYQLAELNQ